MTRKNRRKQKEGHLVPPKFAGFLAILAIGSLFFLYLHGRCEALGREIRGLEGRKVVLEKQCQNAEADWSAMRSLDNVERALQKHGLVMTWPTRDQIVRLRTASRPLGELAGEMPQVPTRSQRVVMND